MDTMLVVPILLLPVVLLWFPLSRAILDAGVVYFQNAFDETSYLSYPYSKAVQSPTRISQYLVTIWHEFGASGGQQNLCLDLVCSWTIILCSRACLQTAGMDLRRSTMASGLVYLLPALLNGTNPLVRGLFNWNLESGIIRWFSVPEGTFLPWMRSPEPQVSLAIVAAVAYLACTLRTALPLLLISPLLYPFVGLPIAMFALAWFLAQRFGCKSLGGWVLACVCAWGIVGVLASVAFDRVVSPQLANFIQRDRTPMLSACGVVAVVLAWLTTRTQQSVAIRNVAVGIAMACLGMQATNIITGYIAQPSNFELGFGLPCTALLGGIWLAQCRSMWLSQAALVVAFALALKGTWSYDRQNLNAWRYLHRDAEILEALRQDPQRILLADPFAASVAGLVWPRQGITGLAYAQTYAALAPSYFDGYCSISSMLRELDDPAFRESLDALDAGYLYCNADFSLVLIGRQPNLVKRFDVSACQGGGLEPRNFLLVR